MRIDSMPSPSSAEKAPSAASQYIYDDRRRRGARKRAAVLARAVEVASTEGLEGLTIGRLAADLGISKGHLTVLFPSKEALQIATFDANRPRRSQRALPCDLSWMSSFRARRMTGDPQSGARATFGYGSRIPRATTSR